MAVNAPNKLRDGQRDWTGGVNSALHPRLLPPHAASWAVNCSFRDNAVGPRPGYRQRPLTFVPRGSTPAATIQTRFEDNWFSRAGVYQGQDGEALLAAAIGGRLFAIDPAGWECSEITPRDAADDLNKVTDRAWLEQADNYLVVQNGVDAPIFYGDGAARRSAGIKGGETPTGRAMSYANGRLWVSRDRSYLAGDLIGSSSGSRSKAYRDAVIKTQENGYLGQGGAFGTPVTRGPITGLRPLANIDTTLGDGELVVFTTDAAFVTSVPTDRSVWSLLQYPVQRLAAFNGAMSDGSVVNVNGDLYYRSRDGIRSLAFTVRQFGQPAQMPLSTEVGRALNADSEHLLCFASGALFNNWLMETYNPKRSDRGYVHGGLVVRDFYPLSSQSAPASWVGVWTGLDILQVLTATVNGRERCFLFVERNSLIELWEVDKNLRDDLEADTYKRIQWHVETRLFGFEQTLDLKELDRLKLWFRDVAGAVDLTVRFRPGTSQDWQLWHSWSEDQKDCGVELSSAGCLQYGEHRPGARARSIAHPPSTSCNSVVSSPPLPWNRGYEFALRIEGTGYARLDGLLLWSNIVPESIYESCPGTESQLSSYTCPPTETYAIT